MLVMKISNAVQRVFLCLLFNSGMLTLQP